MCCVIMQIKLGAVNGMFIYPKTWPRLPADFPGMWMHFYVCSNRIFHPNVDSDFAAPGSTAFSKEQCSNKVKKSSYKGKLQPSIRDTFEKTLNYANFERGWWSWRVGGGTGIHHVWHSNFCLGRKQCVRFCLVFFLSYDIALVTFAWQDVK